MSTWFNRGFDQFGTWERWEEIPTSIQLFNLNESVPQMMTSLRHLGSESQTICFVFVAHHLMLKRFITHTYVPGCWSLACKEWKQGHGRPKGDRSKERSSHHKPLALMMLLQAADMRSLLKLCSKSANCSIPAFPRPSTVHTADTENDTRGVKADLHPRRVLPQQLRSG